MKKIKEPKPVKIPKEKKIKKVKVSKEKKVDVVESLKNYAREFAFNYKPLVYDIVSNAEECKLATANTCWRPDIYLNNDRSCNNCVLYENCACTSKRKITEKLKKH